MIEVKESPYEDRYPDWVNKCPHCNNNYNDASIKIYSEDTLSINFVLCEECRKELADKLLNPTEAR